MSGGPESLGDAAVELASHGIAVFQCRPRAKTPATDHGCLDATTNVDHIAASWRANPYANVAMATGAVSGNIIAIDQDGAEGKAALAGLQEKYGQLPPTWCQQTGGGVDHIQLFFRVPAGHEVRNSASKIGEHIDVRGSGGYTVMPPSIHPSGNPYAWLEGHAPGNIPIADLPEAWLDLLTAPASKAQSNGNGAAQGDDDTDIPEGERDDTIFHLACSRRAKGLTYDEVLAGMLAINCKRVKPPLSEQEVRAKVDSAWRYQSDDEAVAAAKVNSEGALRLAIDSIALADSHFMKVYIKKRKIAQLVRDALLEDGFFGRSTDQRRFYFCQRERRPYDLDSSDFEFLLYEKTGLNTTEDFFKFTVAALQAEAGRKPATRVHVLGHFDRQTGVLAISDGASGIWLREPGGQWEYTHNGAELLFFVDADSVAFTPDFSAKDDHLDWYLSRFSFTDSDGALPLTVANQRVLFLIALQHQFFPELRRTRALLAFLGRQGSGKTTNIRMVGRLLAGPDFDVIQLRKEKEDAFVAGVTNSTVMGPDNTDGKIPWLEDALATYCTGLKYKMREYYTTNSQVSYLPRAFMMLASRTPRFRRVDVAEKILPFSCKRPAAFIPENEIFDELADRRGAIWGNFLKLLGESADAQKAVAPHMQFRLADYAAFGWKLLKAQGRESIWPPLLHRVERAQMQFATEEDGMVWALREVLEKAGGTLTEVSADELFRLCSEVAKDKSFDLPKTANWFMRKLLSMSRAIESELEIDFKDHVGHQGKRDITLTPKQEEK